jgi:hypothetical protein
VAGRDGWSRFNVVGEGSRRGRYRIIKSLYIHDLGAVFLFGRSIDRADLELGSL